MWRGWSRGEGWGTGTAPAWSSSSGLHWHARSFGRTLAFQINSTLEDFPGTARKLREHTPKHKTRCAGSDRRSLRPSSSSPAVGGQSRAEGQEMWVMGCPRKLSCVWHWHLPAGEVITAHTDSSPGNCSAALDVYAAPGAAQLSSRYLLKTFACFMICWHWGPGFSWSVEELGGVLAVSVGWEMVSFADTEPCLCCVMGICDTSPAELYLNYPWTWPRSGKIPLNVLLK